MVPILWTVDTSSFDAALGTWPVHSTVRCPEAPPDELHVLGVAVVVYSRKQATMAWGHASLRTLACVGGQVVDREYETYRLSAWNEAQLRREHAGEPFLEGDWLRTQRGALVLFRNEDPVDQAWYAHAQRRNREIYELWLDVPQEELDAVVRAAEAWHADQLVRMRAGTPLDERYLPWSRNCTTVLQRLVPPALQPGSALPFAWLRALEAGAERRVLYPSAHLLRRWSDAPPAETPRPRPLFRRDGAGAAE